ncbi:cytoplasmic dynein 2 intermediate chain 1 [Osmia bicornis bicornis]|uniref:cytoplasmic dynein 2 intermediate chain 1 n=1 Tax=Osmia bicornis bicornis TaxID=1437191 RepID=UPI001EAF1ED4|nr:cytoplasmic dynein 2 intermediate chain 1 [Osmia bicornis bicornis]
MFHKGAIKKVSSTKDVSQSNIKSKSKSSSSNKESEDSEKLESRRIRTSKSTEQKREDDSRPKLSQSSKISSKQSVRSPQSKSIRETSSSTPVLNVKSSKTSTRNISSSKTSDNFIRRSSSNNAPKSHKSNEKIQSSYSEKRGTSTIYVPQSVTNKLNARLTNKNTNPVPKNEVKVKSKSTAEIPETKTESRQRRLSRTLSPSEIRMLHSATNRSDSTQKVDQSKNNQSETNQIDSEYDYEDDFEDYESDFQECTDSETSEVSEETSNSQNNLPVNPIELQTTKQRKVVNSADHKEEEHMHDSGHYELTEARKRAARIESLANDPKISSLLEIRHPINKTYSEDRLSENKSLPSSTDEGFEDSRSGDFTKSPALSQTSFIEFRKPKENHKMKKSKKSLSRGEELLEMIKLDVMEWSLLECSPIPYEEFIRNYGKLNTQQISTQTGEDNIDVETQTEKIVLGNKWTQFPITCRSNLKTKEDLDLFRMDQIGVGDDSDVETVNSISSPSFDVLRLCDFLSRARRVVLSLLEERRSGGNVFKNEKQVPFSDGVVKLSIGSITFLAGRPVTIIHYSEVLNKILMTIHSAVEEEIETSNIQDYITDCCIGCVWNISEPSMPIKLFYSTCPITACCFHLTNYNVVFAGLQDGSISLWDLKEDEMWHHKVIDKANERNWTIRMSTYTTTNTETNIHTSQIVAIRILSKIEEKSLEQRSNKFVPIQICSLNEKGSLIIWSVLHSMGINVDDLGLSFWGSVRLVKSQEVLLQFDNRKKIDAAAFIDMHVDCVDSNNLYIATNSSNILHATCVGNKANPAVYGNFDTNPCGNVTCIETCPFGHSFFLVGCDDGTIRLHSLNIEKPILQLKDEENKYEIKSVQWSKSKPFTIFVLDNNSRVHMWDLSNSDIHPTYTVNMQNSGYISSMQLSSCKTKQDMSHQYLAFGTESGNVEIHKLKANVRYTKKEDYLEELNTFLRYVTIL